MFNNFYERDVNSAGNESERVRVHQVSLVFSQYSSGHSPASQVQLGLVEFSNPNGSKFNKAVTQDVCGYLKYNPIMAMV